MWALGGPIPSPQCIFYSSVHAMYYILCNRQGKLWLQIIYTSLCMIPLKGVSHGTSHLLIQCELFRLGSLSQHPAVHALLTPYDCFTNKRLRHGLITHEVPMVKSSDRPCLLTLLT